MISENISRPPDSHVNPDALLSHDVGVPSRTETIHVSHLKFDSLVVYATRRPSGDTTGLILACASVVSATGSPSGRLLT